MAEARRNRKATRRQLKSNLLDRGIDVSARTVRRTLFEGGLKARRPRRKANITPDMAKKRLDWAKGLKDWSSNDWKKVF